MREGEGRREGLQPEMLQDAAIGRVGGVDESRRSRGASGHPR